MTYKKGDIVELTIEKLTFGGPGLARVQNGEKKLNIFIDGVVPGDKIVGEIFFLKHNLARARVKKYIHFSDRRIIPRCPHFGIQISADNEPEKTLNTQKNCGGCSWQFISYSDQLQTKFQEVLESLVKVGNIPEEIVKKCIKPPLGMDNPWNYRNKMEFSFSKTKEGELQLGLHMKGRFYDVTEIEQCELFKPWTGKFLQEVRSWMKNTKFQTDLELISLVVRTGTNTGEIMVNLRVENGIVDFEEDWKKIVVDFFEKVECDQDKLVSVYLTQIINKKGQRKEIREKMIWGKAVFIEQLKLINGQTLNFEVYPQAFLQPNTKQSEVFYSLVLELAQLSGQENVFDLFCGTGTIGICLANKAKTVIGIELNASAIENAKSNARLNQKRNVEWLVGDVNKLLPEMKKEVDVVVFDPPRAGLTAQIIETVTATNCRRIVYVSCNPNSLAKDLNLLLKQGWQIELIQPVDQFCQTYHIETVCLLTRNSL